MEELAVGPCRVIPWERRSGPMNMALDVVAARRASEAGVGTVRTYGWEPSTLSLGYAQDAATVDWAACRAAGLSVTRRPTGGGAILHEAWGDVAYSVVLPSAAVPDDLLDAYQLLCQPVVEAFSRLGLDVDFADTEQPALYEPACYLRDVHPAHDLVAPTEHGTGKISGNAQYRQRDAVIQHGSLRFDYDADRVRDCFVAPGLGVAEIRERIASMRALGIEDRDAVVKALEASLAAAVGADPGDWSQHEEAAGWDLVDEKFGNERWIRHREDPLAAAE